MRWSLFVILFFYALPGFGQNAKAPDCCLIPLVRSAKPISRIAFIDPKLPGDRNAPSSAGMVWIPGGEFVMGSEDSEGRDDEKPRHRARVSAFYMDITPVTNAQFARFIEATGYVTVAERVPETGTKPADPAEVAGSMVFTPPEMPVSLNDVSVWWQFVPGANWRHPEGPGSDLKGRENHPVVQVCYEDALAYAKWAGKRLPTEAEWEFAARGGLKGKKYAWGDIPVSPKRCNYWQGHFPDENTAADGYISTSPVKTFPPNGYGLYDMAGNVWQWCADWYRSDIYRQRARSGKTAVNPVGPANSFDPDEPGVPKRVTRGGSFLCNASYCASYRVAARMKTSPDTALVNLGFRCAFSASPPAPVVGGKP